MNLFSANCRLLSLLACAALFWCGVQACAQAPAAPTDKQVREANTAYIAGAKALRENDFSNAEVLFTKALTLDPTKADYLRALAVAKEHHVTQLVQEGVRLRMEKRNEDAEKLFVEAQTIDPSNPIVLEHLNQPTVPIPFYERTAAPVGADDIARLGGAIRLEPRAGTRSFHTRGDTSAMLRDVYTAFGLSVTLDSSLTPQPNRFDLDDADFATASTIALMMAHAFAVPLDAHTVLLAKESPENRDRLSGKIEETIYLPGLSVDQLNELSNVAKTVFDIKQVTVAQNSSALVVRGDDDALRLVNTTYAGLIDGGDDVMLDVHLYEVDKTFVRNTGASLPTSLGAFVVPSLATQLVAANQSLIQQGLQSGLLDLTTGNPTYFQILARELIFLAAAGVSIPQFTNLLGTIGRLGATGASIPFAGVFLGSSTSVNAVLSSSDVRAVDAIQIRVGEKQIGTFRVGSRYPIITSQYSSGITSAQASAAAGLTVNGVNVGSLLNSLASASVPVFQYEDLGLTLKATPQVQKSGNVAVHLDMKIEALGGGSLNSIPILNSRQFTSDLTIPEGQTALLASVVSNQELLALQGIPILNEIPGLGGTNRDREHDTTDLIVTVTAHVVRKRSPVVTSRRVLANLAPEPQ